MVRRYERKTTRGSYTSAQVEDAIRAVLGGLRVADAARRFSIHKMTLGRYVKKLLGAHALVAGSSTAVDPAARAETHAPIPAFDHDANSSNITSSGNSSSAIISGNIQIMPAKSGRSSLATPTSPALPTSASPLPYDRFAVQPAANQCEPSSAGATRCLADEINRFPAIHPCHYRALAEECIEPLNCVATDKSGQWHTEPCQVIKDRNTESSRATRDAFVSLASKITVEQFPSVPIITLDSTAVQQSSEFLALGCDPRIILPKKPEHYNYNVSQIFAVSCGNHAGSATTNKKNLGKDQPIALKKKWPVRRFPEDSGQLITSVELLEAKNTSTVSCAKANRCGGRDVCSKTAVATTLPASRVPTVQANAAITTVSSNSSANSTASKLIRIRNKSVKIGYASSKRLFSEIEEARLIQRIQRDCGSRAHSDDVRRHAYADAVTLGKALPKTWLRSRMASYDWLASLIARHPDLRVVYRRTREQHCRRASTYRLDTQLPKITRQDSFLEFSNNRDSNNNNHSDVSNMNDDNGIDCRIST